jgi:hypothetical protein
MPSVDLSAHSLRRLPGVHDRGNVDVIGFQEPSDVNRRLDPERLTYGKYPRPFYFAAFYPAADEIRITQDRRDVKDGSKSPTREHLLEL